MVVGLSMYTQSYPLMSSTNAMSECFYHLTRWFSHQTLLEAILQCSYTILHILKPSMYKIHGVGNESPCIALHSPGPWLVLSPDRWRPDPAVPHHAPVCQEPLPRLLHHLQFSQPQVPRPHPNSSRDPWRHLQCCRWGKRHQTQVHKSWDQQESTQQCKLLLWVEALSLKNVHWRKS